MITQKNKAGPFLWGAKGEKLTPEQVERLRESAAASAERGVDYSPVGHWTQGAARLIDAFGGYRGNVRADKEEQAGDAYADEKFGVLRALIGGDSGRGSEYEFGLPAGVATPQSEEERLGDAAMQAIGKPPISGGNFPASLISTESGGNWNALNDEVGAGGVRGHGGRLQFGQGRLTDATRAGVIPQMTPQQFAQASPEVQQAVENWHFADIDNAIDNSGAAQMIGQTINGIPVTRDGLRAVAHLGGSGGMEKFVNSRGQYNPADSFGTSLSDYLGTHAGGSPMGGSFTGGGTQMADNSNVVAALTGAMSDPWVAKKYGPAIQAMLGQQMRRGDMDYQAQLQAEMQANDPYRQAQIRKMEADAERAASGGDISFGKTPVWGTDAEGNPAIGTIGDDGSFKMLDTGGFNLSTGVEKVDLGDRVGIRDKRSGEIIGYEAKGGAPSPDQRPTADGGVEALPGSTLDINRTQEAADEERRRIGREASTQRAGQTVTRAVDRALEGLPDMVQGSGMMGAYGRAARAKIKGTPEYNFNLQIQDMLSNVGLDVLQQMRENSPTGGALGQVPIQQQQRLEQVLGSFDLSQDPEILRENLQQLNNIYMEIQFGSPQERRLAIQEGRMTQEQSDEIDRNIYETSYDKFGRRKDGQPDADGWSDVGGVKIRVKQ